MKLPASQASRVRPMSPDALQQLLRSGAPAVLLDVRTEQERRIAAIPHARAFEGPSDLEGLDPSATLVVYCHHGIRSRAVAERLAAAGFCNVFNLEGGIDAWATSIDPIMARY